MFLRLHKYSLSFLMLAGLASGAQGSEKKNDVGSANSSIVRPFPNVASLDFNLPRAIAAGSACKLGDNAFISQTGPGSLEIKLSDFYVSLADNLGLGRSRLAGCRVIVPVSIPSGYAVAEVQLAGSYFIYKSRSTQGSFAVRAGLIGSDAASSQDDFPLGQSAYGGNLFEARDRVSQNGQCNPLGSGKALLSLQFSASVIGDSSELFDFELGNEGRTALDLRLAPCP